MAMEVVYTTIHGQLVHESRGGTESFYSGDTLGNLTEIRDASGVETYGAEYWPYGELQAETGNNPTPWGFVGLLGYMRDFADLLYVRSRFYRPQFAIWQTVDRFWPKEDAYRYVLNQPTSLTDPRGYGGELVSQGEVEAILRQIAIALGIVFSEALIAILVELILAIAIAAVVMVLVCAAAKAVRRTLEQQAKAILNQPGGACGGCCGIAFLRCPCVLGDFATLLAYFVNSIQIQLFCFGGNMDPLHLAGIMKTFRGMNKCRCTAQECFPVITPFHLYPCFGSL